MARRGLSYSEAKRHVRKFRRKANPNAGFVAQLRLLDERLQENTIQNFLEAGGLADQGKGPGAEEQEKGFVLAQGGVAEEGDGGREGVARQRQKQGLLFRPSAGSNGNGSGEEGNGKGNGNGNGTGEEGNGNGEEGAVLDGRQGRAIGDRMKSGREELKEPGTKYEEALEEATVERGVTTPVSPAKRELGQMTGRNGWSSSVKLACRFTGQAVPTGLAGPVGVPALEPTESTEPPESGESQNSLRQRNGVGLDESAGDRCFAEENEVLIGDEWDAMLRTAERRGCAKKLFGAREEGRGETGREEHVSALLVSPYVGLKALQSQQPAKLGSPFAKGNEEQQNKELSLGDGSSFPPAQAKRSRMKNGSGCHSSATKNYFGLASSAPRSDVEDVVEKRIDGNGTRVHFGVGTGGQDRSGLEVCPADDARALSPAELDRNKRESADRDTERGTGAARFALLEGFAWELATMDWLAGVCFRALGMAKTQSRALA